jgi:hypothetical protein
VKLGGQPREASWILNFSLSKTSPGAYRSYRMYIVLALLIYACVDCALRIGFLDDGDRLHGVPFRILFLF